MQLTNLASNAPHNVKTKQYTITLNLALTTSNATIRMFRNQIPKILLVPFALTFSVSLRQETCSDCR